jgi:hypothetical protein
MFGTVSVRLAHGQRGTAVTRLVGRAILHRRRALGTMA